MTELIVVTYDIDIVEPEQIDLVREQLDEYRVTFVVVPKGITVEFAKPARLIDQATD